MTKILLQQIPADSILIEFAGTDEEIAHLLIKAMAGNLTLSSIVLGSIPAFLDIKNISREDFCNQILNQ